MLQVFPSYHTDEIPIWGLFRSSSDNPTPYKIACDAPWDLGSVILELYLFSFGVVVICGGGVVVVVVGVAAAAIMVVARSESEVGLWVCGVMKVVFGNVEI